jgi:hypothetical protein
VATNLNGPISNRSSSPLRKSSSRTTEDHWLSEHNVLVPAAGSFRLLELRSVQPFERCSRLRAIGNAKNFFGISMCLILQDLFFSTVKNQLRVQGFEVVSVMCKLGCIPKNHRDKTGETTGMW